MKAWVLHDVKDLRYEEIEKPKLGQGEVLVAIKAVGICGSDVPRIYRDGAHKMPLVPGHEFAGEVVAINEDVDAKWLHKRVGIFPLIPCRECFSCKSEKYEMCRNYSYIGSRQNGAFAEYVAVPADNLIELPESVSYDVAAMLEPMAVAMHALRRVLPGKDETVVVCGLGTIGMLIVMLLKSMGITNVLAIGNKDFQREIVEKVGVGEESYCDIRKHEVRRWILDKTQLKGAAVFFECVGANNTILQAIDNTMPGGKVCLVGNPHSDVRLEKAVYWKILRHQLQVTGTWNSSFTHDENDDWHTVLKMLEQEVVSPELLITHRFALAQLEKGICIMRDKTEDYCKIIVKNE